MKAGNHQTVDIRDNRSDHRHIQCLKNVLPLVQKGEAEEEWDHESLEQLTTKFASIMLVLTTHIGDKTKSKVIYHSRSRNSLDRLDHWTLAQFQDDCDNRDDQDDGDAEQQYKAPLCIMCNDPE